MRLRLLFLPTCFLTILQLIVYAHRQASVVKLTEEVTKQLQVLERRTSALRDSFRNLTLGNDHIDSGVSRQVDRLKNLIVESRRNFVRIKGVPEKANENLEEKIVELADFLDIKITSRDIEKANRIGTKRRNGARAIVAQMASFKIKQQLIREASATYRNLEFTIQDDLASYVMPNAFQKSSQPPKDCHKLASVSDPEVRGKSDTIFGAWMRDPLSPSAPGEGAIWVFPHFYDTNQVDEYTSLRHLSRRRPRVTYTLPYERAGTGHVVYNGSIFFNKFNSSLLVKFSFKTKSIEVERNLPDAAFANSAPYQWSGSTDIDFAADELGLWVIYATLDNALDIVISKLDPNTLEVLETWKTNWRKQWSGNAFMLCGVLYVLKKYDEQKTSIGYTYDTRTKTYKHGDIPFVNNYQWNTMLAYNHKDHMLYAWDRGFLVNYNVTLGNATATV